MTLKPIKKETMEPGDLIFYGHHRPMVIASFNPHYFRDCSAYRILMDREAMNRLKIHFVLSGDNV
jgi:hypothetical protein